MIETPKQRSARYAHPAMNIPPNEFSFDRREWYRLLLFLGCLFCISGFLAGVVGGHSWPYTFCCAIAGPVIFTPLFWLLGCRFIHRSYLISADGIILRRRDRDLERIALTDIADVRPWPLVITLHSGRKISFHLARSEMLRARDALLHVFPKPTTPNKTDAGRGLEWHLSCHRRFPLAVA